MKIKINMVLLFCLVFLASGCSTFQAISLVRGGEALSPGPEEKVLPAEFSGHMILVKGHINGSAKEYRFILDTAALTMIDKETATELRLARDVEVKANDSAGGTKTGHLTKLGSLTIGGITVTNTAAVIMDMTKIREMTGIEVDGIIGSNFLRFFTVKFDYQRQQVSLSGDLSPLKAVPGATLIRFKQSMKQGFAPMVEAASGDASFKALIDTGLNYPLSLPLSIVKKTDKEAMIEGKGAMGGGFLENNKKEVLTRLNSFRMGSTEFGRVVANGTEGKDVALIGKEFLSRFVVTLNYPAGEMLLVPVNGVKEDDNIFTTGIGVMRDANGKFLVSGVWSGSPADQAGVAANDEIVMVNGKGAADYTLGEMRAILKTNDGKDAVDLAIKNAGGERNLTIKKQFLFAQ
ncbi:aspartyl protease family protein [Geotalea toluenoxydans]|uniref:aspartyl protease family protein n=1 Tax=Geotalea toluenoxydans TaxID=421624 RepID=UPI0006CFC202|nr:aspartyl protease family protein [Geotalea toluenoxydans]